MALCTQKYILVLREKITITAIEDKKYIVSMCVCVLHYYYYVSWRAWNFQWHERVNALWRGVFIVIKLLLCGILCIHIFDEEINTKKNNKVGIIQIPKAEIHFSTRFPQLICFQHCDILCCLNFYNNVHSSVWCMNDNPEKLFLEHLAIIFQRWSFLR